MVQFLYLIYLIIGFDHSSERYESQIIDFCELKGAVYVETENRAFADFIVYKEESEGSAQFWVYEEFSRTYADQPGMWYFVKNRGIADFVIYYEKEPGMADFGIFFTETAAFAGCQ